MQFSPGEILIFQQSLEQHSEYFHLANPARYITSPCFGGDSCPDVPNQGLPNFSQWGCRRYRRHRGIRESGPERAGSRDMRRCFWWLVMAPLQNQLLRF